MIANREGTASTERYASIARRSTNDDPYGPLPQDNGSERSFPRRADLIQAAEAVVLVEVLSISSPHFNSHDGGFYVSYPSPPIPVQDVRLRIVEKWGDLVGLSDEFVLTVPGGQIEVLISEEQAERGRLAEALYQDPGKHVLAQLPSIDLAVSEKALLLLAPFKMVWQGGGREVLQVVAGNKAKFVAIGDEVRNAERPEWSGSARDLRQEIARELGKRPIPS